MIGLWTRLHVYMKGQDCMELVGYAVGVCLIVPFIWHAGGRRTKGSKK